jgi:hypothetical protein
MKTIIIFLLASVVAFSQTREPEQHTFSLYGNPTLLDSQNDSFKIKDFQLGWHWGSMKVLSRAMLMNQADISTHTTSTYFHPGDFNTNTNYFVRAYYDTVISGQRTKGHLYSHCKYDDFIVFTNGITYDPTLYVNPANPYELNIREGDPQNPVFGFLNKKGTVINDPLDDNYSRFIMTDNNPNSPDSLSEPWLSMKIYYVL